VVHTVDNISERFTGLFVKLGNCNSRCQFAVIWMQNVQICYRFCQKVIKVSALYAYINISLLKFTILSIAYGLICYQLNVQVFITKTVNEVRNTIKYFASINNLNRSISLDKFLAFLNVESILDFCCDILQRFMFFGFFNHLLL